MPTDDHDLPQRRHIVYGSTLQEARHLWELHAAAHGFPRRPPSWVTLHSAGSGKAHLMGIGHPFAPEEERPVLLGWTWEDFCLERWGFLQRRSEDADR